MSAQTEMLNTPGLSCWFEIPVTDLQKSKQFYETVFNIKMIDFEDPKFPNPMVFFTDPNAKGAFGHLYPGKPAQSGEGNTVHILATDQLEEIMPRVEKAGGKIISPIVPLPVGRFAYMTDPDGNSIGIFNWAKDETR